MHESRAEALSWSGPPSSVFALSPRVGHCPFNTGGGAKATESQAVPVPPVGSLQRGWQGPSWSGDCQAGSLGVGGGGMESHGKMEPFHVATPLLESWALSQVAGTAVFLKCENVQPAGSFKIRGIGYFCQEGATQASRPPTWPGSWASPPPLCCRRAPPPQVVRRLEGEGAEVQLAGKVWDEANMRAQELAKRDGWVNVHPFDHPLIWEGNASLVRELKAALGTPPAALVLAVGGGGLLLGVVTGLVEVGWQHVPIIAMETRGAHCLNAATKAGKLVTLPDITSVAKSLGAKTVAARALECAREYEILSEVVEDAEAVSAAQRFLDDERMLVEPACGAALAAVYSGLLGRLRAEGRLRPAPAPVVVIVCGGNNINSRELQALRTQLGQS